MFWGQGDIWSTVIWFLFFLLFIFFGPRLMMTQSILKLEKDVSELESLATDSMKYVSRKIKAGRKEKMLLDNFMNFFTVMPVQIDPAGVMKKLDQVVKQSDKRLTYFVDQIAPRASDEEKMNIKNGIAGAMTNYQIAKVLRHWLELIKKHKMFQYAMVIQMQIPLIKELAVSANKATKAFVDGIPIGDAIGPLTAATMMKGKPTEYREEEFAVYKTKAGKKTLFVSKAAGPGATTGYPGKFVSKFINKNKIDRIITIDAGLKLEGEKSGEISEGVGIAMGGIGTERYEIESVALKKNIPMDAIVVKESQEDALSHMSNDILKSVPRVLDSLDENLKRVKKSERILIIGVGNTGGVGNSAKEVPKAEKLVKDYNRKNPKKEEKKGWF